MGRHTVRRYRTAARCALAGLVACACVGTISVVTIATTTGLPTPEAAADSRLDIGPSTGFSSRAPRPQAVQR